MGNGNKTKKFARFRTNTSMKYRPSQEPGKAGPTGTRPLAEAATVGHIMAMMVVHVARKILYGIDVSHKVGLYIIGTLVLSVISDFGFNSRNYMSQSDNVFNLFFVKYSWGWTMLFTGLFTLSTSLTYSCGQTKVIKNQLMRLLIATSVWYGVTGTFLLIEDTFGFCSKGQKIFHDKTVCLRHGLKWKGFDISGHCFLLVWNSLFMVEEATAYLGWEKIKDMLRNEEYQRLTTDLVDKEKSSDMITPLSKLSLTELILLRKNYSTYTVYVRVCFVFMALFSLLWDVMLVCTALYFHMMIEKVIACSVAILIWFFLYRVVYPQPWSPGLPGQGPFIYVNLKKVATRMDSMKRKMDHHQHGQQSHRWHPKDEVPKFMGMPLYALGNKKQMGEGESNQDNGETSGPSHNQSPIIASTSRINSRIKLNSGSKTSLNSKLF